MSEMCVSMKKYRVTLTLTEDMLGTTPKSKEVYAQFIASKAAKAEDAEEEVKSVEDMETRGWTGFHQDETGKPFVYNYMLKGFLKNSAKVLNGADGVKGMRSKINDLVFVSPRKIPLNLPEEGSLGVLERPLRAETMQGPRVTLVRSDTVPAGTTLDFTLEVWGDKLGEKLIRQLLTYGSRMGLGCWRNGGYGSFEYEMTEIEE